MQNNITDFVLKLCILKQWALRESVQNYHFNMVWNLFNKRLFFFTNQNYSRFLIFQTGAGQQEGHLFFFNGYHKCFSNSTPSERHLPFSTPPNYSSGMKLKGFAFQKALVFSLTKRFGKIPLNGCIMEAGSQSSSQQILWKDVSLFSSPFVFIAVN